MARVSRISASAVALAMFLTSSAAYAQCEGNCSGFPGDGGPARELRDNRVDNQRDPVISEPRQVEELVFVPPPLFQLPASNSPVTRSSGGQIRSSWAVGVFR